MTGLPARHCRHCWGNCSGNCMVPGADFCIHENLKGPQWAWVRGIRTRRFWLRVLYGSRRY